VDDPVKCAQRERTQTTRYDLIVIDPDTPKNAKRGLELDRDLVALLSSVESGEILLKCANGGAAVPCGVCASWRKAAWGKAV
jgi:23S rRNA G2069 N7-methylase RlmK/C1962 C5-methylase RlmI